jgi:hypothetical protein
MAPQAADVSSFQANPAAERTAARDYAATLPANEPARFDAMGYDTTLPGGGTRPFTGERARWALWQMAKGIGESAQQAATLPARAWRGEVDTSPDNPGMIPEAINMTSWIAAPSLGRAALASPAENALGMFGGRLAHGADMVAQAQAERMLASGASREDVWRNTGWWQGPGGHWMFEMNDQLAGLNKALPVRRTDQLVASQQDTVLGHGELYHRYPEAADALVYRLKPDDPSNATYIGKAAMELAGRKMPGDVPALIGVNPSKPAETQLSGLLHENQHLIQDKENWPIGANGAMDPALLNERHPAWPIYQGIRQNMLAAMSPDEFAAKAAADRGLTRAQADALYPTYVDTVKRNNSNIPPKLDELARKVALGQAYERSGGEALARLTQKRQNMSPEERAATPPWTMFDVPEEQQIIQYRAGSPNWSKAQSESARAPALGRANSAQDVRDAMASDVINRGAGVEPFTPYPADPRYPGIEHTVSTLTPTNKIGGQLNQIGHTTPNMTVGIDSSRAAANAYAKNAQTIGKYPGVDYTGVNMADPEAVSQRFMDHVVNNLLQLHDAMPAAVRARAKLWYDGANHMANMRPGVDGSRPLFNPNYGTTPQQNAAVLATQSPQRDWYQNVSLAKRINDIHHTQGNTPFSPEMGQWLDKYVTGRYEGEAQKFERGAAKLRNEADKAEALSDPDTAASKRADADKLIAKAAKKRADMPAMQATVDRLRGTRLDDHVDPFDRAVWTRAYDEAHNSRNFHLIAPEGYEMGPQLNADRKTPSKVGWGSFGDIAKAISVLQDGSMENITRNLGDAHKVRNFYNNIISPNSPHGHVTIDTHAIAAGHQRPLAGSDTETAQGLGQAGSKSDEVGSKGMYGLFAEAYRRAAALRGILPREMQSITWEGVRGLFPEDIKTDAFGREIKGIWNGRQAGQAGLDAARRQIWSRAGGMDAPTWWRPDPGTHAGPWNPYNEGQLPRGGLRAGSGNAAANSGGGGQPPGGNQGPSQGGLRVIDPNALGAASESAIDTSKLPAAPKGGIEAYHGSPHSFDKFDISKIGTGEGAQAYGHGLYFAEHEPVAQGYRDKLAGSPIVPDSVLQTAAGGLPLDSGQLSFMRNLSASTAKTPEEIAVTMQGMFPGLRDPGGSMLARVASGDNFKALSAAARALDEGEKVSPGSMYQVRINADPEHFLDWDKPLSEQSPKVQEALGLDKLPQKPTPEEAQAIFDLAKSRGVPAHTMPEYQELSDRLDNANDRAWDQMGIQPSNGSYARPEEMPGSTLYQAMEQGSVGPHAMSDTRSAAVAQKLRDAGIPGIRYKDAGSRSTGKGTYNYVTFSDDIVKILRKYGIAGLGIGTGVGLAHRKMKAE